MPRRARCLLIVFLGSAAVADETGPFIGAFAAMIHDHRNKVPGYEGGYSMLGLEGGYLWRPWLGLHGSLGYGDAHPGGGQGAWTEIELAAGPTARWCNILCAGARVDFIYAHIDYADDELHSTFHQFLIEPAASLGAEFRGWGAAAVGGARWGDAFTGYRYGIDVEHRW